MLDRKTLYAIYLLHKAGDLYSTTRCECCDLDSAFLGELRLRGYLFGSGRITRSLDDNSLVELLKELEKILDPLHLPRERKAEFPRTLRQFNRSYSLWLSSIKSSDHNHGS